MLLLAAVHDLLLAESDHELAAWYPSVADVIRDDDPYPAFAALCRSHDDQIRETIATRSTQTNEVGRCAFYLPVMTTIEREVGPLSLLDVGASAGLNLNLDRYQYRYTPGGVVGAPSSVVIDSGTRGDPPIPDELPSINARFGVDRDPVDLSDPTSTRWLMACVWPDQIDRADRLRAAIRVAHQHPVEVRRGDAVDDVEDAIEIAAGSAHPVVMNSWVLSYLSSRGRDSYVEALDHAGQQRDLSWVFAEMPYQCPELPMPDDDRLRFLTLVVLVRWRDAVRRIDHVATVHPHGHWIHWGRARTSSVDEHHIV